MVIKEDLKNFSLLAQMLDDHIRFEERQLFNAIEKAATPQQSQILSAQLKDAEAAPVWEDAFWIQ